MKRIIHVVAGMDPSAGPTYSVAHLSRELNELGHDSQIVYVSDRPSKQTGATGFSGFPRGNGFAFSPGLTGTLISNLRSRDTILHNHGLWLWPNILAASLHRFSATSRLVVSPRGMMEDWAWQNSAKKKRLVWQLGQKWCLAADMFHATAASEADAIRARGYRGPIVLASNGVDIPDRMEAAAGTPRDVLYLGRIHPKKGLDLLLEAWSKLDLGSEWRLKIVGKDEGGTLAELQAQVQERGLSNVSFSDPVFGDEKTRTYQRAAIFVLPTRSENFALTVAEALANGTPVVCTEGAPWSKLTTKRCGVWVPISADGIAAGLRELTKLSPELLRNMGERGRQWMIDDYSWRTIAERMSEAYAWLSGQGPRPKQVLASSTNELCTA